MKNLMKFLLKLRVSLAMTFDQPMWLPSMSGGVADALLIFRNATAGALTVDETTATGIDCGPTPLDGLPIRVHIPTDCSGTITLSVVFLTCDTLGGTYLEEDRINASTFNGAGAFSLAGIYRARVAWRRRFVKCFMDVTGTFAGGAVDVRAESAGEGTNAPRDL